MNKNELYSLGKFIVVSIIAVPILVNILMMIPTPITQGDTGDWISFYGSYIGSILGLFGVVITIAYMSDQAKKDRKYYEDKSNEDRRNSFLPILKYVASAHHQDEFTIEIKEEGTRKSKVVYIKNIGLGTMCDVRIESIKYCFEAMGTVTRGNLDTVAVSESFALLIDFKVPILNYYGTHNSFNRKMEIKFRFNNLFGDNYTQTLILNAKTAGADLMVTPLSFSMPEHIK